MDEPTQMDAWGLFKVHHAVRLHFTTDYDYFKYNGKTSYKREAFEHRKDKHSYTKMKRIFEYHDYKHMEYYIAWLFFTRNEWVTTDVINTEQLKFDLEWKEYSNNRVANFAKDYQRYLDQTPEMIFHKLIVGDLHWATILVLDKFIGLAQTLNQSLNGRYLWDQRYAKLAKFAPFYHAHEPIHEMSFRQMIKESTI